MCCSCRLFYFNECRIDERRKEVVERRERVKQKCADRHNQLMSSQALQEFKRNADEVCKQTETRNVFGSVVVTRYAAYWSYPMLQRDEFYQLLFLSQS